MRVVVFAEDLSGRRDDGYYTKPTLAEALSLFFSDAGSNNFLDAEGNDEFTREDAEVAFEQSKRITFYNEEGEKIVIAADSASY